jgi:hypothetical protein
MAKKEKLLSYMYENELLFLKFIAPINISNGFVHLLIWIKPFIILKENCKICIYTE